MFNGCSANDTFIGPDLPCVEFVEADWYVSAYIKMKILISKVERVDRKILTFLRSGIKCLDPHPLFPYTFSQSS